MSQRRRKYNPVAILRTDGLIFETGQSEATKTVRMRRISLSAEWYCLNGGPRSATPRAFPAAEKIVLIVEADHIQIFSPT
jgi:hypothetical protein